MAAPSYEARYDLNGDGWVDDRDVDILKRYYLQLVNPNDPVSVACDFNGDGRISALDYSLLIAHAYVQPQYVKPIPPEVKPRPMPIGIITGPVEGVGAGLVAVIAIVVLAIILTIGGK